MRFHLPQSFARCRRVVLAAILGLLAACTQTSTTPGDAAGVPVQLDAGRMDTGVQDAGPVRQDGGANILDAAADLGDAAQSRDAGGHPPDASPALRDAAMGTVDGAAVLPDAAGPVDGAFTTPDAAGEPADAAVEATDAAGEPVDAAGGAVDAAGEPADAALPLADAAVGIVDAAVGAISLLPEPRLPNPRVHFGTGGVVNNAAELFPTTPPLDGFPESPWFVAQWKKLELMRPDLVFSQAASTSDPLLGLAQWAFPTPSNESHLWVYAPPPPMLPIFELYGEHGWLDPAGGSNVFLSTNMSREFVPDHRVQLVMNAKVRSQVTFYGDAASMTDGSVAWQYFTGLVFQYVPTNGGPRHTLFMQIRHADSRATTGRYLSASGTVAIYGGLLPGDVELTGATPDAPLQHLEFELTRYLCDAVTASFPDTGGGTFTYPAEARNLANWRVGSLYHGIETQDALGTSSSPRRGAAAVAVQVSGLDVVEHLEEPLLPLCP